MDAGRDAEALGVADDAMALAVEHDLTVDRTDLTSILARLSEIGRRPRGVDPPPRGGRRRVDQRARPRPAARDAHPRVGPLPPGRPRGRPRGVRAHPRPRPGAPGLEWSVYGVDTRAMAVTTAYEMGDWDHALRLADHAHRRRDAVVGRREHRRGRRRRPRRPRRGDGATSCSPAPARGGRRTGGSRCSPARRPSTCSAATATSTRMLTLHARWWPSCATLWGAGRVAAEVRLAALAVGHLATALRTAPPARRAELLDHVDRLADEAARRVGRRRRCSSPPTLEGRAWEARVDGRARAGPLGRGRRRRPRRRSSTRGARSSTCFERHGEPYEAARARARLAEVLLAAGDRGADEVLAAAREPRPLGCGAAPLARGARPAGAPRPRARTRR